MTEHSLEHQSCDDLFKGFTEFEDIRKVKPPSKKGVYVIRIAKAGVPASEILERTIPLINGLHWPLFTQVTLPRLERLSKICDCPVIYIGQTGNLKGRYKGLTEGHIIMVPIWALMYFGWELDYGWKTDDAPADLENALIGKYQRRHHDCLPALNSLAATDV